MTVGDINWHALVVCGDKRWLLMHVSGLLVAEEEGVLVNHVWVMGEVNW